MNRIALGAALSLIFCLYPLFAPRLLQDQVVLAPAPDNIVHDVFFFDGTRGWALAGTPMSPSTDVLKTNDGGLTWRKVGTQSRLYRLFFLDDHNGWALGICGSAEHGTFPICVMGTSDGGVTWARLSTKAINPPSLVMDVVYDLDFIDGRHGWVVGQSSEGGGGMFLETADGGLTFSPVKIGEGKFSLLTRIFSDSDGHLCVLGNHAIYSSRDRGKTWQPGVPSESEKAVKDDIPGRLTSGWMFPRGRWLALGSDDTGEVLSTADYGLHWTTVTDSLGDNLPGINFLNDVSFYDESHGCAILGSSHLFCTADAGNTWSPREIIRKQRVNVSIEFDQLNKIVLLPSGFGLVISHFGFVYQTSDWGQTWVGKDLIASASK